MSEIDNTVVVVLQSNQADWYYRHSQRFISALVGRINGGETDKYPGYSRWDGDGIPGMQVVWNEPSDKLGVLSVGSGSGQKLIYINNRQNKKDKSLKVSILKMLAKKLGYKLVPNNK